jgi:hypothetical protein
MKALFWIGMAVLIPGGIGTMVTGRVKSQRL